MHEINGQLKKTISCVDQPTKLEQRLENARQFREKFNFEMPILVDSIWTIHFTKRTAHGHFVSI